VLSGSVKTAASVTTPRIPAHDTTISALRDTGPGRDGPMLVVAVRARAVDGAANAAVVAALADAFGVRRSAVAIVRGQMERATVVLGSATPSLESFYNCVKKKFILLPLPTRADDKKMPIVRIVTPGSIAPPRP